MSLLLLFKLTNVNRQLSIVTFPKLVLSACRSRWVGLYVNAGTSYSTEIVPRDISFFRLLEADIDIDLTEVWIVPLSNLGFKECVLIIIINVLSIWEICDFNFKSYYKGGRFCYVWRLVFNETCNVLNMRKPISFTSM